MWWYIRASTNSTLVGAGELPLPLYNNFNFWKACILSKPELQSAALTIMQRPALLQCSFFFFSLLMAMLQHCKTVSKNTLKEKYLEGAENIVCTKN